MKKKFMAITVMVVFLCAAHVFAAGTVTQELYTYKDGQNASIQVLELDVFAGASGVVTSVPIRQDFLDKLVATPYAYWLQTIPSTPNPQALYDITFTDIDGWDILGGKGGDRSATDKETVLIAPTSSYPLVVPTGLTFNMTGNNVTGAHTKVRVFFVR